MPNPENIEQHKFTSENQPATAKKSRKGIPNRATVFNRLLKLKTTIKAPDGSELQATLYEAMAFGQAQSAINGNTAAFKEIQDSIHGKQADKQEVTADVTQRVEVVFTKADDTGGKLTD